jgi:hypothetical protein
MGVPAAMDTVAWKRTAGDNPKQGRANHCPILTTNGPLPLTPQF